MRAKKKQEMHQQVITPIKPLLREKKPAMEWGYQWTLIKFLIKCSTFLTTRIVAFDLNASYRKKEMI